MANSAKTSFILILSLSIFAATVSSSATAGKSWFENIRRGNEMVSKLHFYVHDVLSGPNQTLYEVANASITSDSATSFGLVRVADDRLTAEPDINSEVVGRGQGLVPSSDLQTLSLTMNVNFVFTTGKYNGSTISILGRNPIFDREREVPVVGGTGFFRFARGYAITRTYSLDLEAGHLVFEYTLYVTSTYVDA